MLCVIMAISKQCAKDVHKATKADQSSTTE